MFTDRTIAQGTAISIELAVEGNWFERDALHLEYYIEVII